MNQADIKILNSSRWASEIDAYGGIRGLQHAMRAHNGGLDAETLQACAIVGAASEGQRLARICAERGIKIETIVDDDPAKAGLRVAGWRVAPVQSLLELPKTVPVVIASHRVLHITRRLRDLGFKTLVPFAMLQVLAPDTFPPHMFYEHLLEDLWNNRAQYRALHERLADDQSRRVLEAVISSAARSTRRRCNRSSAKKIFTRRKGCSNLETMKLTSMPEHSTAIRSGASSNASTAASRRSTGLSRIR